MKLIKSLLLCLLLSLISGTTQAQIVNSGKFGSGLLNIAGADSMWTMRLGFRFQTLAIASFDPSSDVGMSNPEYNMLIRRSRIKMDGIAFSPKLKYKFEMGLSNRDVSSPTSYTSNAPRLILDAVVKWEFAPNTVLWFGQTKLPGNIERVVSSANLQLVDRSLLNSFFNIDRDTGFQLRHSRSLGKSVIRGIAAISQGEGRNITSGNQGGLQYTFRLEYLPLGKFTKNKEYTGGDLVREPKPRLFLAASYDLNDHAVRERSNMGSYMTIDNGTQLYQTNVRTAFADVAFKWQGFSLMTEVAKRWADSPIALNSDGTQTGDFIVEGEAINVQMGYLTKSNVEIAARYTRVDFNGEESFVLPDREQYTLGVSKYIVGHKLKVQSDVSYMERVDDVQELMIRLQCEVHF